MAALSKTIFKVQSTVSKVIKDTLNEKTDSMFASLGSVLDLLNPVLLENQLVLTQFTQHKDLAGWVLTTCLSAHDGTESLSTDTPLLGLDEGSNKMQALGSAITYARRYSLMTLFKLVPMDDDGNGSAPTTEDPPALEFVKGKKADAKAPPRKGKITPVDHKIGDGKYKNKKVSEIPKAELLTYIDEIDKATAAAGKKHPKWVLDLKQAVL